MAFCELKYFSPALQKHTAANILLPQGKFKPPYSVFYLLHGLSDDHTRWMRQTSIERYVDNLPLIVVMPDGERNWYCDAIEGPAFETALIHDLVGYVDQVFPTKAVRSGRCIGGLSMGGYGSMKLALKFPEMFCSATSHSGAIGFATRQFNPKPDNKFDMEMARIMGVNPIGGANDCYALAEKVAKLEEGKRPALRIDCGTEDFLLEDNRKFKAHLEKIGYKHEYQEFTGTHEWKYWDTHVQEAIQFHLKHLDMPK